MIGETVSHYRITERIGGGGMGVVYRAEDTRLKRTVALKFLSPELTRDERAKRRFVNEAQAASQLDHPNICTIHEIDETEDGRLFIAQACYEGETVGERLEKGPMPLDEAIAVAVHVARGLEKAHSAGIVHRDIKPDNVFLTDDGRAKILDFGLAKLTGETRMTRIGSTVGTVAYMSPEQARGNDVSPRSDIWSLGVVLYEALTGELPFPGDRPEAVLYSVVHEEPRTPSSLRHDVTPELEAIIMQCIDKDPDSRFQSAGQLAAALEPLRAGRSSASAPIEPTVTRIIRVRSGRRVPQAALVAGALACVVFFVTPVSRRAVLDWVLGAPMPETKLVAVVPFTNEGDEEHEAFVRGLGSYITLRLAQLERSDGDFRIVPAAEFVEHEIVTPSDARDISGATLAITGTVRREGDEVSLGLDLVNAGSGHSVWPFWRRGWHRRNHIASLPVFQTDAVLAAAEMVGSSLVEGSTDRLSAGRTTVPVAFDTCMQGFGRLYDAGGRSMGAVALFEKAVSLDGSYALAYAGLGMAYCKACEEENDPEYRDAARGAAQEAISLNDRLAEPHVTLGLVNADLANYEVAESEFERALTIEPVNPAARRGLARAQASQHYTTAAENTYQAGISLRKSHWAPYFDLGRFYYTEGEKVMDAIPLLEQATELAPRNAWPHSLAAAIYHDEEMYEEARTIIERAVAAGVKPNRLLYSVAGTVFFALLQYSEASEWYEGAVLQDSTEYVTWGNLASASRLAYRKQRAKECYWKAIELAKGELEETPGEFVVLADLAEYYASLGEVGIAKEYLRQAIGTVPTESGAEFHIGLTLELLGERDEAIRWIARALDHGFPPSVVETAPDLRKLCADERYLALVPRASEK